MSTTIQNDTAIAEEMAGLADATVGLVNPAVGAAVGEGLGIAEGAAATIEAPHQTLLTGVANAIQQQTPAIIAATPAANQAQAAVGLNFITQFLKWLKSTL